MWHLIWNKNRIVDIGCHKVGKKFFPSFLCFSRAIIILFQRLSQQNIYVIMTFIYQGSFRINYYSFDSQEPVVPYCAHQQFSCTRYSWLHMDCLTQAAPEHKVSFPRDCTEFPEFSMFREIPKYSRFVATLRYLICFKIYILNFSLFWCTSRTKSCQHSINESRLVSIVRCSAKQN